MAIILSRSVLLVFPHVRLPQKGADKSVDQSQIVYNLEGIYYGYVASKVWFQIAAQMLYSS